MRAFRFFLVAAFASFISGSKLVAQSKTFGFHFGYQMGNFYQEKSNSKYFHNGALPFTLGLDYYPLQNFGFRLSGIYSFLGDGDSELNFTDNVAIKSNMPNVTGTRRTSQRGLKFSTKFWLIEVDEATSNIGFETGFGVIQHRFTNDLNLIDGNRWIMVTNQQNKILTPLHFGVAFQFVQRIDLSVHYNYFPSLGWQNEIIQHENFSPTYFQPQFKRGFISATLRLIYLSDK